MTYHIRYEKKFRRDYKRIVRRHYDIFHLQRVVEKLVNGEMLPIRYKDHQLYTDNKYVATRECHIEPDWLLIYQMKGDQLILIRTGSHSDLFH